jgi:hypothetical protein
MVENFIVTRDGHCSQGSWGAGEVLVCRGQAADGDAVVLVPRGPGRPRVGRVQGTRLIGDAGEQCHHSRWRVAGRLVATWRQRTGGWLCELIDTDDNALDRDAVSEGPAQLSLFGIAA